ncbi:MAG: diguanylate cyclase [Dehalococcoidia bacterium]|nr:MAG: diguanylate cyclase [Dehalococcoidia bacterium]
MEPFAEPPGLNRRLANELDARRQEQTPQALARLVVVALFISLWFALWAARIPMPVPFLATLAAEAAFFLAYWRGVFLLRSVRQIELAHYAMLGAEIVFHTTMVYFLGGISWLGAFAYVFGLIFTNTFLDLRRGLVYTASAALAFSTLVVLEATGVIPYYAYLRGGPNSYRDAQFVVTTGIGGAGVFFSIYLWVNWVGHQLRVERDAAIEARDGLLAARTRLQQANIELESRVAERTAELQAANTALRDGEQVLRETIESTTDGVLAFYDGRLIHTNGLFGAIWDIEADVLTSHDTALLTAALSRRLVDPGGFLERVRSLYETPDEGFEVLEFTDGRYIESYSRALLRDGAPAGRVWSFRDVTERKQAEKLLRDRAEHDGLTGTLNHAAIIDALRAAIASQDAGIPCAVAMVDVDGMKATNDSFGHPVGDAVLLKVAEALRRAGGHVGRYGGDEFLVVLPGCDRQRAEAFRTSVLEEVAMARIYSPRTASGVPIDVSIGLAVYPEDADSVAALVQTADTAMYAGRRERRAGDGKDAELVRLSGDRAAQMIGEIVPLLTSPGELGDKLRLVSQRLSLGAGYAGVAIDIFAANGRPPMQNLYVADAGTGRWMQTGLRRGHRLSSMQEAVMATKAPIMIDHPAIEIRMRPADREALRLAGIQSALIVPMVWQDEVIGQISVGSRNEGAFTARDAQFLTAVANQVTAIVRMATTSELLAEAQAETVIMLAAAAEAHDRETGHHLHRVRSISEALALELGYGEQAASDLALAAVLHDIGKVRVPDTLLSSTGQLDEDDWYVMQQHTIWGEEFLRGRPGFELAADVAAAHHERWDGGGYPRGLAGEHIPEAATIVAVADSFDAMTHDRPYRAGRSVAMALEEIQRASGTQFNPRVVDALLALAARGKIDHGEDEEQVAA